MHKFFHGQVFDLLKELDGEFIEHYVLRRELLFLTCLPVTPNCHRVIEIDIGSSWPKVMFVSYLLHLLAKFMFILLLLWNKFIFCWLTCFTFDFCNVILFDWKDDRTKAYKKLVSSGVVTTSRVLECLSFSRACVVILKSDFVSITLNNQLNFVISTCNIRICMLGGTLNYFL